MSVTVAITLKEIPTKCGDCKFYSEHEYQCHSERGTAPSCLLGFMTGDLRDHSYRDSLYKGCKIKDNLI